MEPASTFGTYRLLEPLGEGGMGRVWKAIDLRLERVVALKVLKVVDAKQRSILVAEAKTACQLHHPHIAVIFEAGEVDGAPFIAMEFLQGDTLRSRLGRPQPEAFLREILLQAASALAHARQKGIIHRDIKPDNLLVTPQGQLKLLDFGVAKRGMPSQEETTDDGFTVAGETVQGISMGTPAYMSPEQAHGLALDPATDQFSLGLVLIELALGFHPFRKPTLLGTLHAITEEPVPNLSMHRPDLSPALARVIHRMLEKDSRNRFPSMEAIPDALAEATPGPFFVPAPSAKPRRRSIAMRAGIALILLLAAVGGWRVLRSGANPIAPDLGQGRRVVAILPIEIQGIPSDQLWLGESFQDAMASGLLRRGDLLVLDRTRVAETLAEGKSKNQTWGPKQVSSELGADLLLMSTLQAAGDRLRLSLRLIRGQKGEVLDQITFEGGLANTLSVEDDLEKRVPALFGTASSAPMTERAQARLMRTRECFIRGLELAERASTEDARGALALFEEALRSEPDYAPAHVGVARALNTIYAQEAHSGKEQIDLIHRAVIASRKALELDANLSMAHRTLGQSLERVGDHFGAQKALQKAVELDPADYRAIAALGDSFAYRDDPESRALARLNFQRALAFHPRYSWANYRMAVLLLNEGDLKTAIFHGDRARQLDPSADYHHLVSALALLWLGDLSRATQRIEEGLHEAPGSSLLQLTQAICDYARADQAAFRYHANALSTRWPPTHPVGVLLQGLDEGIGNHVPAMRDRFLAFAKSTQSRHLPSIPTSERRVISVNAYHMAHALAQGGQFPAARILLEEAERMQPGKFKIAAQDPMLKRVR